MQEGRCPSAPSPPRCLPLDLLASDPAEDHTVVGCGHPVSNGPILGREHLGGGRPPCVGTYTMLPLIYLGCFVNQSPTFSVITRPHAAVLALYALGGARDTFDTEDVAVRVETIAPGMFSWKKYQDRVDKEL